ncbi:MAG: ComF family protein [Candidatus Omnitrophota bacterium]
MLLGLFKSLKDLFYPNCCLACKNKIKPDSQQALICFDCLDKIELNLPPFCSTCGRHLNIEAIRKNTCKGCQNTKFYFDRAFSPYVYTGVIKKLIHEFKYSGKDYLGESFGTMLNTFIRNYNLPIQYLDYIIPIPLHQSRLREREFNQALILSREIAKEFNKKVLTNILVRNKATKTQTELDFKARKLNMQGSFLVREPKQIDNTNLLLIDDVLTTAATANAAAESLKAAGAKTVILLTLAN